MSSDGSLQAAHYERAKGRYRRGVAVVVEHLPDVLDRALHLVIHRGVGRKLAKRAFTVLKLLGDFVQVGEQLVRAGHYLCDVLVHVLGKLYLLARLLERRDGILEVGIELRVGRKELADSALARLDPLGYLRGVRKHAPRVGDGVGRICVDWIVRGEQPPEHSLSLLKTPRDLLCRGANGLDVRYDRADVLAARERLQILSYVGHIAHPVGRRLAYERLRGYIDNLALALLKHKELTAEHRKTTHRDPVALAQDNRLVDLDLHNLENNRNVATVNYNQREQGYLTGYAAGLATTADKSVFPYANSAKKIALVAAQEYPVMNEIILPAFEEGAKAADSGVSVEFRIVGNWYDASKSADIARSLYEEGVDVILPISGGANQGVISAAQSLNFYVTWFDNNGYDKAPGLVISSMALEQKKLAKEMVSAYLENKLDFGKAKTVGIKDGYITFVKDDPVYRQNIPETFVEQLSAVEADIKAGKLKLPATNK